MVPKFTPLGPLASLQQGTGFLLWDCIPGLGWFLVFGKLLESLHLTQNSFSTNRNDFSPVLINFSNFQLQWKSLTVNARRTPERTVHGLKKDYP